METVEELKKQLKDMVLKEEELAKRAVLTQDDLEAMFKVATEYCKEWKLKNKIKGE